MSRKKYWAICFIVVTLSIIIELFVLNNEIQKVLVLI